SAVAQRIDDSRLAEHRLAGGLLEAGLMDQSRKVVLIRKFQCRVVLVCPAHRQLQRAAGVKARRPRISMHRRLRLRSRVEDGCPFPLKKTKLAHGASRMFIQVTY